MSRPLRGYFQREECKIAYCELIFYAASEGMTVVLTA
jgi:hypothetical protein